MGMIRDRAIFMKPESLHHADFMLSERQRVRTELAAEIEAKSCAGEVSFTSGDLFGGVSTDRWGPGSFAPRPYAGYYGLEGMSLNSICVACVSALCFGAMEPPLRAFNLRDGKEEVPWAINSDHYINELIHRPNPLQCFQDLMATSMSFAAQTGSCILYKQRDDAGLVRELWPYTQRELEPMASTDLGKGFIVRSTNREAYAVYQDSSRFPARVRQGDWISPRDVVVLPWPVRHPSMPWRWLSPSESIGVEISTDDATLGLVNSMMATDGIPFVALNIAPDAPKLTPDQRAQMKMDYAAARCDRSKLMIAEGGAGFSRPGLDFSELNVEVLHRTPESRACAVHRVPAIIAGVQLGLERATYANFQQAREMMAEDTLVPIWSMWQSQFNHAFQPEFGRWGLRALGVELRFDTRKVVALQEVQRKLMNDTVQQWLGCLITRDEARRVLGHRTAGGKLGNSYYKPEPSSAMAGEKKVSPVDHPATDGSVSRNGNITATGNGYELPAGFSV